MGVRSVEIGSLMFIHYLRASRMCTYTFYISWPIWVKFDTEHPHLMPLSFSELREIPFSESHISLKDVNEFLCGLWKCIDRSEWNSMSEFCVCCFRALVIFVKIGKRRLYFSNGRKRSYTDSCFAKVYGILKEKHSLVKSVDCGKKLTNFATLPYSAPFSLFFMKSRYSHLHSVRKFPC